MSEEVEIQTGEVDFGRRRSVTAIFDLYQMTSSLIAPLLQKIVSLIAERYVSENYTAIVEHLSPEAVANMAIAQTGVALNKTLQEKIPDKIVEVLRTKTEVYQKGLFGGLRRI